MDFKTFYTSKTVAERDAFDAQAGTSRGYCNQIAYAKKQIELGMADVLVALSNGQLTLDDLPLTDRAKAQRVIRDAHPTVGAIEVKAVA